MNFMKIIKTFLLIFILSISIIYPQVPVTISVNTSSPGIEIPNDFLGFSFGTGTLFKGPDGYVFDSTNTQLLNLFKELGIKNLRIGGTTVDNMPTPPHEDIDALFRFAKAAGVKVIYSLRLANGNPYEDASAAKYIRNNYKKYLYCFSIGNEMNYIEGRHDPEIRDYQTYLKKWRRFASVIRDSVPDAMFGGPDATTTLRGISWGPYFARDEKNSGMVRQIFYHYYVGSDAHGTAQQLIDSMLSKRWDAVNYPERYDTTAVPAMRYGFSYRFTEANSYCGKPVKGGSDAFATALFSLDFLYWWASHGCPGIDFHCTMPKLNSTIYIDENGNFQVHPVAYGLKAFSIGAHGRIIPTVVSDSNLNVTAYSVLDSKNLYVTIVNKEHGKNAKYIDTEIDAKDINGRAEAMYLEAPNNNAAATDGITLGGYPITNNGLQQGKWNLIDPGEKGIIKITVPSSSAVILRILRK